MSFSSLAFMGPYVPQSTIINVHANPGTYTTKGRLQSTRQGAHQGCRNCQKLWRVVPAPGSGEPYLVRLPDWVLPPRQDVHGWWFCEFKGAAPSHCHPAGQGFYLEHHFPPETLFQTRSTRLNSCGVLEWRPHLSWADLDLSASSWRMHKLAVPWGWGPYPMYAPPLFPERPRIALATAMARSASAPESTAVPGSNSSPEHAGARRELRRTQSWHPTAEVRRGPLILRSEGWCPTCMNIVHVGRECPRKDQP